MAISTAFDGAESLFIVRCSFLLARRQATILNLWVKYRGKEEHCQGVPCHQIFICCSACGLCLSSRSLRGVTRRDGERKAPRPAHRTGRTSHLQPARVALPCRGVRGSARVPSPPPGRESPA